MSHKKLSRREFLRAGALTASAAALAACAPAGGSTGASSQDGGSSAASSEPGVIKWWAGWGQLETAVNIFRDMPEFQEHIGDNTLEYKGGSVTEPLLAAFAAGDPPDGASNIDYPGLWARGVALPVNDFVNASTVIDPDDVVEAVWQGAFYDGQMIGVPSIESFLWYGLNYNAQHVEEAGLDPDNPPLTWEGVLDWHKALTKFDDGGNLIKMGLDPIDAMAGEPDFAATSFGFQWWDEENRTFNLNDPLMAEAINMQAEFFRYAGPDQMASFRSVEGQGSWGAAYSAEVQSMIIEGYWHAGETQNEKPDVAQYNRATWAPVPAAREGAKIMATGPHFVQIYKDGQNPEGMFKVSEFLHTAPALDTIFTEVGWIMGVKSWMQTLDPDFFPGLRFYIEANDQVTDWIIGRRSPIHWFVNTQLWELREQVYRDLISPTEAVEELQARALAEWDAQGLE